MHRYPQPAAVRPRPAASASSQAGTRLLAQPGRKGTSWRTSHSPRAGAPVVHLSARHSTSDDHYVSREVQAASRTQMQDERMVVESTPAARARSHAPRSQLVSFLPFPGSRRDIPLRLRSRAFCTRALPVLERWQLTHFLALMHEQAAPAGAARSEATDRGPRGGSATD